MTTTVSFDEWQAICNAKAKYCRYLDSKDWLRFADLFTEDYELDVSEGTGVPPIKGRDEALAMVKASIAPAKTAHQVHTPEMSREGDAIKVIWAMQDRVIWGPDKALTGYGNYHETWVNDNGTWKIAYLKLTRFIVEM